MIKYTINNNKMVNDMTKGPVMRTMLCFAVPMILGNLLQQCYNITKYNDRIL